MPIGYIRRIGGIPQKISRAEGTTRVGSCLQCAQNTFRSSMKSLSQHCATRVDKHLSIWAQLFRTSRNFWAPIAGPFILTSHGVFNGPYYTQYGPHSSVSRPSYDGALRLLPLTDLFVRLELPFPLVLA